MSAQPLHISLKILLIYYTIMLKHNLCQFFRLLLRRDDDRTKAGVSHCKKVFHGNQRQATTGRDREPNAFRFEKSRQVMRYRFTSRKRLGSCPQPVALYKQVLSYSGGETFLEKTGMNDDSRIAWLTAGRIANSRCHWKPAGTAENDDSRFTLL